jgi:ubiquinone/menaquinone biosynthesis C-methylase UbiE
MVGYTHFSYFQEPHDANRWLEPARRFLNKWRDEEDIEFVTVTDLYRDFYNIKYTEPGFEECVKQEHRVIDAYIPNGALILDVGTKNGRVGQYIEKVKNARVIYSDISKGILHNKRTVQENAKQLSYKDNTFDAVIAMGTIWLLENTSPREALLELYRVTKNILIFDTVTKKRAVDAGELYVNPTAILPPSIERITTNRQTIQWVFKK